MSVIKDKLEYAFYTALTPLAYIQVAIGERREAKKSDDRKKFEKDLKDELNKIREE